MSDDSVNSSRDNLFGIEINSLFRNVLSGLVFVLLLVFLSLQTIQGTQDILSKYALLWFVIAIVVGNTIYSVHRAVLYQLIIRSIVGWLSERKSDKRYCFCGKIEDQYRADFWRWELLKNGDPLISHVENWATQIHVLFCTSYSIILALVISSFQSDIGWRPWSLGVVVFLVLFCAGLYSNQRLYQYLNIHMNHLT